MNDINHKLREVKQKILDLNIPNAIMIGIGINCINVGLSKSLDDFDAPNEIDGVKINYTVLENISFL